MLYSALSMKLSHYFLQFSYDLPKIGTGDVHENLTSDDKVCENRRRKIHASLTSVNIV